MEDHGTVKKCICEVCGKQFSRPNHLKTHGKIHTMAQDSNIDEDKSDNESEGDSLDVTKKSFKCRLCKMEFPSTSSLKVDLKKKTFG